MSRYQDIDTSNCTEIWAGTAFYQDCFGQTVCKTLYYIQPYIIWVILYRLYYIAYIATRGRDFERFSAR